MGRTVDSNSGIAGRMAAQQLGAIRAGLANGSMVRGQTEREASGQGRAPTWGVILLPDQVDAVTPPLGRGQGCRGVGGHRDGDGGRERLAGTGGGDTGDGLREGHKPDG